MKVAIVTPTIGTKFLSKCVESVDSQTYQNLVHYVFIDGAQYLPQVEETLLGASKVRTVLLEENVGKGWYGHRVYAASSFLVDADIICYLDEDNWLDPTHVEKMVNKIKDGNDWVYSLRKIYDKDENYLCDDNCESLGKWPVFFDKDNYLIDTSCFAVKRDVALQIGHSWYGQWGADRQFFKALREYFPNYSCTSEYSLCYRLDGNPNSVKPEFFEKGNEFNSKKYNGKFPWTKQNLLRVAPNINIVL
jgi:glycosyltransferase involved in cell wall biosynthesis